MSNSNNAQALALAIVAMRDGKKDPLKSKKNEKPKAVKQTVFFWAASAAIQIGSSCVFSVTRNSDGYNFVATWSADYDEKKGRDAAAYGYTFASDAQFMHILNDDDFTIEQRQSTDFSAPRMGIGLAVEHGFYETPFKHTGFHYAFK